MMRAVFFVVARPNVLGNRMPAASCGLSGGCPFEAERGDWSYHTSVFAERPE
jgi:hypothetical protein